MEENWVTQGYAAPNKKTYPWQWLWDSCFHSLIWLELGRPDRAEQELTEIFRPQLDSGFVPHINYVCDPDIHSDLWGRSHGSSITQPPMYGHAIAELNRAGVRMNQALLSSATAGLSFLINERARHDSGLLLLCHPWESGADDSPRWDNFCPGGFNKERWKKQKNVLVKTIEQTADGSPLRNPEFQVASIGFNALVAFNARELAAVTGDKSMADSANEITHAIAERWDESSSTWKDAGPHSNESGSCRTLDALLPLLVVEEKQLPRKLVEQFDSAEAFKGRFGPRGVHLKEKVFNPKQYWRGPVWPQLSYLISLAVSRFDLQTAKQLALATANGAQVSGCAEYWHPETGEGLGAIPQSWAGLSLVSTKRLLI